MSILVAHMGTIMAGGGGALASSVTWNSADKGANITLSESDKRASKVGSDGWSTVRAIATRAASDTGGFYFEVVSVVSTGGGEIIGIANVSAPLGSNIGGDANGWGYYNNGNKLHNSGATAGTAYSSTWTTNDNIGVFLRNGSLWFRKNGTWIGDPDAGTGAAFTGITGTIFPAGSVLYAGNSSLRCVPRVYSLPTGAADW